MLCKYLLEDVLEKKDLEFAEAMQLKLRLNREQQTSQGSEVSEAGSGEQSVQEGDNSLRASIAQKVMQRHPSLTQEEVEQLLERDGF